MPFRRLAPVITRLVNKLTQTWKHLQVSHWVMLAIGLAIGGLFANTGDSNTTATVTHKLPVPAPASTTVTSQTIETTAPGQWHHVTVKTGDNLAAIFSRLNIGARQWYNILESNKHAKHLKRLQPGENFDIRLDDEQQLQELVYKKNKTFSLRVLRTPDGFSVTPVHKNIETRIQHAHAVISSSLFESGQQASLSDSLIMELVGIFGWDIDFALDIRRDDNFTIIYQEKFLDGEKIGDGNILAAEFVNQGKTYRAVRYTDAGKRTDYYTPDGHSMRKAFLRTPVSYSRISSRFGKRRHPILNRMRAHRGVDYSTPTGTPIKAAGDGKIIYRGRKGGYGKTIVIRHGSKYSTLYAHMSRYKRGLRSGKYVKQGQIIGYVGRTGLATGPHLHYEFRLHGRHRNPLTIRLPDAKSIHRRYKADYLDYSQGFLTQLDVYKKVILASSSINQEPIELN